MRALNQLFAPLSVNCFLIFVGVAIKIETIFTRGTPLALYKVHDIHLFNIFTRAGSWGDLVAACRAIYARSVSVFLVCVFIDPDRIASFSALICTHFCGCEILIFLSLRVLASSSFGVLVLADVVAWNGVCASISFLILVNHGWGAHSLLLRTSSPRICVATLLKASEIICQLPFFNFCVYFWEADAVLYGRLVYVSLVSWILFVDIDVHVLAHSCESGHGLLTSTCPTSCYYSRDTAADWSVAMGCCTDSSILHARARWNSLQHGVTFLPNSRLT